MSRFSPTLAAWLLACSTPFAGEGYPTTDLTPEEAGAIERSAYEWNPHTLQDKHITCDVPFCWIDGQRWQLIKVPIDGYAGWTWGRGHLLEYAPGLDAATLHVVSLHEFGHALGLNHTVTGVMVPVADSTEFTPEVLAECRKAKACP